MCPYCAPRCPCCGQPYHAGPIWWWQPQYVPQYIPPWMPPPTYVPPPHPWTIGPTTLGGGMVTGTGVDTTGWGITNASGAGNSISIM